jgi:ubiquinone/menaquinone biosynthesis C-methylase UbiE
MKDEYSLEADWYDMIWGKYDYDNDVKFLNELFKKHGCKNIIDVGCGTGNHAIRLEETGYEVIGVDVSPTMLRKAREKTRGAKIAFLHGDMRELAKIVPKDRKFDAAICLGFATAHLLANKNVKTFLSGLHSVLKKNGLFVCNVRNAGKIREDRLNKLNLDHLVNEEKCQLVVLAYNTRHPRDRNIIVWRPIFFINRNGKLDFQIREHKLRWFKFSTWKRLLIENGFDLMFVYSGPAKQEFKEDEHEVMWFVAKTR